MSMKEKNAMAQLRRDFESYMKGEVPSSIEIGRAPLLEHWRAVFVHVARKEDPKAMLLVLVGSVAGHPQHSDGTRIYTSQLIWLDRSRKWARTWNRVYLLGGRGNDEADTSEQKVTPASRTGSS
ncbi:hypothetical protein V1277_002819 [Bradyrhizobium sp. AZCC 1588]|uniref:DUF6634 family protein n=1 Tax=unclassified Bradyrhizobium TaxID=2631580 RepID=UPI002FF0D805